MSSDPIKADLNLIKDLAINIPKAILSKDGKFIGPQGTVLTSLVMKTLEHLSSNLSNPSIKLSNADIENIHKVLSYAKALLDARVDKDIPSKLQLTELLEKRSQLQRIETAFSTVFPQKNTTALEYKGLHKPGKTGVTYKEGNNTITISRNKSRQVIVTTQEKDPALSPHNEEKLKSRSSQVFTDWQRRSKKNENCIRIAETDLQGEDAWNKLLAFVKTIDPKIQQTLIDDLYTELYPNTGRRESEIEGLLTSEKDRLKEIKTLQTDIEKYEVSIKQALHDKTEGLDSPLLDNSIAQWTEAKTTLQTKLTKAESFVEDRVEILAPYYNLPEKCKDKRTWILAKQIQAGSTPTTLLTSYGPLGQAINTQIDASKAVPEISLDQSSGRPQVSVKVSNITVKTLKERNSYIPTHTGEISAVSDPFKGTIQGNFTITPNS